MTMNNKATFSALSRLMFQKDHVTLKPGVMMLQKKSVLHNRNKFNLKSKIENFYKLNFLFSIVIIFQNITALMYIFDQINRALDNFLF